MSSKNVAFYIAKRYFFSNPERNTLFGNVGYIKILSIISMVVVGLATGALIILLSVFNGLEDLTKNLFRKSNPELKITPVKGKSFEFTEDTRTKLTALPELQSLTEVIQDNALLRYDGAQMVVTLKGVTNNFLDQYSLDSTIIAGEAVLKEDEQFYAIIGAGIYYQMDIQLTNWTRALQFWYPKNQKRVQLNPAKAFYKRSIMPRGVFSVEQQLDMTTVIVPIEFMQNLMKYENKRTALEVKAVDKSQVKKLQNAIQTILGDTYKVETAEEQQAIILRAVKIERLFTFIALTFVLIIASFNIFASLVILTIEKKRDIAVMKSMGTTAGTIRKIFIYEGGLIGFVGAGVGLTIAFIICFLQQEFGLVSMGVDSAIVPAYPVIMKWPDFVLTGITMAVITIAASLIPAINAAKTPINRYI